MAADQPPDPARPRRVFVSWSHASDAAGETEDMDLADRADGEWREQVRMLVTVLRVHGIDADADIFHGSDIDIDWTRYGPNAVAAADVVLAVVNAAWREAWNESGDGRRGRGAFAEIDVLRSRFNDGREGFQGSLVLVNLPGSQVRRPLGLDRVPRVQVPTMDSAGIAELLRMLTGQPEYPLPPLGPVPVLRPREQTGGAARPLGSAPPVDGSAPPVDGATATGSGDAVIEVVVPAGDPGALAIIEGNAANRHFAVRPVGGSTLVNTVDVYQGTAFLPLVNAGPTLRLEVKASGGWSVTITAVEKAERLQHGGDVAGSGDAVLLYEGPGGVAHIVGNEAGKHFAVQVIPHGASRGRSVVNTVDGYEGSVLCPPGPVTLVVHAVGRWTIGIS